MEQPKYKDLRITKKFVLIDEDRVGGKLEWKNRIVELATRHGVEIIWQSPCHEALLLRHLEGFAQHKPANSPLAIAELKKHWNGYEKGRTRAEISKMLDFNSINRAAMVETELRVFLTQIGLIPPQNG